MFRDTGQPRRFKNKFEIIREKTKIMSKPKHYTEGSIEPLEYIVANDLDFIEGNIIKYVTRYKYKNGVEDLKKAHYYLEVLIKNNL